MDELVQWLREQLDEDERKARAAAETAGSDDWRYTPGDDRVYALQTSPGELWLPLVTEAGSYVGDRLDDEIGVHIARHGPARVLAEVDAKRQVLAKYTTAVDRMAEFAAIIETVKAKGQSTLIPQMERDTAIHQRDALHGVLRLLALPYAGRPGYREEWAP